MGELDYIFYSVLLVLTSAYRFGAVLEQFEVVDALDNALAEKAE